MVDAANICTMVMKKEFTISYIHIRIVDLTASVAKLRSERPYECLFPFTTLHYPLCSSLQGAKKVQTGAKVAETEAITYCPSCWWFIRKHVFWLFSFLLFFFTNTFFMMGFFQTILSQFSAWRNKQRQEEEEQVEESQPASQQRPKPEEPSSPVRRSDDDDDNSSSKHLPPPSPSIPTTNDKQPAVAMDKLEFAASRDLALFLGDHLAPSNTKDLVRFPSLECLSTVVNNHPPVPKTLPKKKTTSRMPLYRPKSIAALRIRRPSASDITTAPKWSIDLCAPGWFHVLLEHLSLL